MKFSDMQFMVTQMRAMRAHAEIVSGAYKMRKVWHGTESSGGALFTEDELLKIKVEEMDSHIRFMQEIMDLWNIRHDYDLIPDAQDE